MKKRYLIIGLVCTAIAASIMAIDLPYYAIGATLALISLLVVWLSMVLRDRKAQKRLRVESTTERHP